MDLDARLKGINALLVGTHGSNKTTWSIEQRCRLS